MKMQYIETNNTFQTLNIDLFVFSSYNKASLEVFNLNIFWFNFYFLYKYIAKL